MKTKRASFLCPLVLLFFFTGLCALLFLNSPSAFGQKEDPGLSEDNEVQTRGPVHEAFASTINYNPEPGPTIPGEAPALIEEQPPDLKPEGKNVVWISGYWAWDDDRNNFIWISGIWRDLPPGRQWIPGYWNKTNTGFQWISGYWTTLAKTRPEYLPEPPQSLERGSNIEAPSEEYVWVPGVWVWQGRYVWRPGYWIMGRTDLSWVPDTYIWTPHGCIYIEGYWDYPVVRRGILFAPVYWERPVYVRRDYFYRPSIVINLAVFSEHLFVRSHSHHYYFGDYYASSYRQRGFYASINFGSLNRSYDPVYSQRRWENRRDTTWQQTIRINYETRRDNVSFRPARNLAEQRIVISNPRQQKDSNKVSVIASPLAQVAVNGHGGRPLKLASKAEKEKQSGQIQRARLNIENRKKTESSVALNNPSSDVVPVQPTAAVDGDSITRKERKDARPSEKAANLNTSKVQNRLSEKENLTSTPTVVNKNEIIRGTPSCLSSTNGIINPDPTERQMEKRTRKDNAVPKQELNGKAAEASAEENRRKASNLEQQRQEEARQAQREEQQAQRAAARKAQEDAGRQEQQVQRQQRQAQNQAEKEASTQQEQKQEEKRAQQESQRQSKRLAQDSAQQQEQENQGPAEKQSQPPDQIPQPQSEKNVRELALVQEQKEQAQSVKEAPQDQAQRQAEKQAQEETQRQEQQAQRQAERQAQEEARRQEQHAQRQTEKQAQEETRRQEQQAQRQAERQAQEEAQRQEQQAQRQAEKQAQEEARRQEQQAQRQAERQAQEEARRQEQQAQRQAERQAQEEARRQEQQAQRQAERQAEEQSRRQGEKGQRQAEKESQDQERQQKSS